METVVLKLIFWNNDTYLYCWKIDNIWQLKIQSEPLRLSLIKVRKGLFFLTDGGGNISLSIMTAFLMGICLYFQSTLAFKLDDKASASKVTVDEFSVDDFDGTGDDDRKLWAKDDEFFAKFFDVLSFRSLAGDEFEYLEAWRVSKDFGQSNKKQIHLKQHVRLINKIYLEVCVQLRIGSHTGIWLL